MYDEIRALDALVARLRDQFPTLIDLSTGRIERLLDKLGRPQDRLANVIHVAGTNGKGSTTAFLRAMAEAAGLKANVLTSPHLVRFAERIRLAGTLITEEALRELIERVVAVNAGDAISFNEMLTAMAFQAFSEVPADVNIVEVGLGGRFDSTNVFAAPAVSVITPVDLDHLELLGPELSKIAWEKAGIIKAGRPVVSAHQPHDAAQVIIAQAEAIGAPLMMMGRDFDAWAQHGRLTLQAPDNLLDLPTPALAGRHQFENAGVAAMAALMLAHPRLDETAIGRGIAQAVWPARLQRLRGGPLAAMAEARGADLWLDGGHNPHAGRALAAHLADLAARDGRPTALITAMYARKDAAGFFAPFADLAPVIVTTTFEGQGQAPPEDLALAARSAGLQAATAPDVTAALKAVLAATGAAPHVLICGGLHFAGEVLAMSPETWPQ